MSPEQSRGHSVDKRGDIWAFGCVLYEMLTGRVAFAGDTASDIVAKILEHEPDWSLAARSDTAVIRRLLLRCLTKDPKQRLRDIGDARIDLDGVDEMAPAAFRSGSRLRKSPRRGSRWSRWPLVAFALAGDCSCSGRRGATTPVAPAAAPLRLSATLAGDASLASFNLQFGDATILSPDGTVIVFVGQKGDGDNPQLYVRRLEQLQATPFGGTDGALMPFFSPDGRWIGFFADQKAEESCRQRRRGRHTVRCAESPRRRMGRGRHDRVLTRPVARYAVAAGGIGRRDGRTADLTCRQRSDASLASVLPGGSAALYRQQRCRGLRRRESRHAGAPERAAKDCSTRRISRSLPR